MKQMNEYRHQAEIIAFLLILLAALAVVGCYLFLMRGQTYTAETVLTWQTESVAEGEKPDLSGLFETDILSKALKKTTKPCSVDDVRNNLQVTQVDSGDAAPREYRVTYTHPTKDAKAVLQEIINRYLDSLSPAGASPLVVPDPFEAEDPAKTGYFAYLEYINRHIRDMLASLESFQSDSDFYSNAAGYSLEDLKTEYEILRSGDLTKLYSLVISSRLTGDREALLTGYHQKLTENAEALRQTQFRSQSLQALIETYQEKDRRINSLSDDSSSAGENTETYESLMEKYVDCEMEIAKLNAESVFLGNIISAFAQSSGTSAVDSRIAALLPRLEEKLAQLDSACQQLADDCARATSPSFVRQKSAIRMTEKYDIKRLFLRAAAFAAAAAVLLFILLLALIRIFHAARRKKEFPDDLENENDDAYSDLRPSSESPKLDFDPEVPSPQRADQNLSSEIRFDSFDGNSESAGIDDIDFSEETGEDSDLSPDDSQPEEDDFGFDLPKIAPVPPTASPESSALKAIIADYSDDFLPEPFTLMVVKVRNVLPLILNWGMDRYDSWIEQVSASLKKHAGAENAVVWDEETEQFYCFLDGTDKSAAQEIRDSFLAGQADGEAEFDIAARTTSGGGRDTIQSLLAGLSGDTAE